MLHPAQVSYQANLVVHCCSRDEMELKTRISTSSGFTLENELLKLLFIPASSEDTQTGVNNTLIETRSYARITLKRRQKVSSSRISHTVWSHYYIPSVIFPSPPTYTQKHGSYYVWLAAMFNPTGMEVCIYPFFSWTRAHYILVNLKNLCTVEDCGQA